MKLVRYTLVLIACLLAPTALAQSHVLTFAALEAPDGDGGFSAITTLDRHYDATGRLDSVIVRGFDLTTFTFGINERTAVTVAAGPEAGQTTQTETVSRRRNGVLDLDEQIVTVLDDDLPLVVTNALWDGSAWVPTRRETATYENDAPRFILKEDWSDEQWVVVGRSAISENASPQELIVAEGVQLSDGTWIPQFRFRLQDQTADDLLARSATGTTELVKVGIFAAVPLSAEDVRLFTPGFDRELSDGMGGWLPDERAIATTDADGRITDLRYETYRGGNDPWSLDQRIAYTYGAQGGLDTVTYYDEDDEYDADFVYAYGMDGQVETATLYSLDDGERVLDIRYRFTWQDASTFTANERAEALPAHILTAAFPNPAVERAAFTVTLDAPGEARVAVYDVLGRTVAVLHDGPLATGAQPFTWHTGSRPSGVYLIRLETARGAATRMVTVAR